MKKTLGMLIAMFCIMMFSSMVLSADFQIKDYVFKWIVFKSPNLEMNIEKKPGSVMAVLAGPGGGLGRISATPEEAKAIGEVLKKTEEYYQKQTSKQEINAKDLVEVGNFKVSFTSSRGRNFGVSVATSKIFSEAANMSKEDALAVAPYLCQAPEMAALVQKRINP